MNQAMSHLSPALPPPATVALSEQAGFKLEAQEDAFKNSEDDHSKLVFDPSIRHKTDQFLYQFRKPK